MKTKTAGFEIKAFKPEIDIEEVYIGLNNPRDLSSIGGWYPNIAIGEKKITIENQEMQKDLQAMDIVVGICIALLVVMVVFM